MPQTAIDPSPAAQWQAVGPDAAGFTQDVSDKVDFGVRAGLISGLHSVVVTRHGALAFERYYAGDDFHWGAPLGPVAHGPETLHDLRSVTKSIVSLLYGIALGRGLVAAPEASLLQQFPQYADLAADPRRAGLTIAAKFKWSKRPIGCATSWTVRSHSNPAKAGFTMAGPRRCLAP